MLGCISLQRNLNKKDANNMDPTINIPNSLPLLAKGSHPAGSGKACVMNAISYITGDTVITDMPRCADGLLSRLAQRLNDSICGHRRDGLLCNRCTHLMWIYGARIIGTAESTKGWSNTKRAKLSADIARFAAEAVSHLRSDSADDAAYAANAAAYVADAAADAAAYAADAAADAAASRRLNTNKARFDLHMMLVDEFYRLTELESTERVFSSEEIEMVRVGAGVK